MNDSGLKLLKGYVTHTRTSPVVHRFKYSFFQIWLDVERPKLIDKISWFWSSEKSNLVRFKRENYLPNDGEQVLNVHQKACEKIKQQTGKTFTGKIYLLASLSYWGYCYNPVSFYIAYNNQGEIEFILSEIHNTPWGERFTYVHDAALNSNQLNNSTRPPSHSENQGSDKLKFKFDKKFHVSPFMPMDLQYDWSFKIDPENLLISMNLQQQSKSIFNATLNLKAQKLTKAQANKLPFYYPFMCLKVLLAIYWNALYLWIKGVKFHDHPKT